MAVIAWIGLGNMGGSMSVNLAKAGHEVRGFDLSPQAVAAAEAGGVKPAGSIAEAVAGADVVFTMLPKGEHARTVYLGDDGVLAHADTRTLLVDSSTIDIASAQALHDAAAAAGFRFVDAPVSGGMSGAKAATLTFMIGGEAGAVAEATEYIRPMAANIIPTGGPTTGQAAKICNNLMLFINLASTAEGAVLADRLGPGQAGLLGHRRPSPPATAGRCAPGIRSPASYPPRPPTTTSPRRSPPSWRTRTSAWPSARRATPAPRWKSASTSSSSSSASSTPASPARTAP